MLKTERKKLYSEEVPYIVRAVRVEHVKCMGGKYMPPRHRWEDNIKINLREIGCEDLHWNQLSQNRIQQQAYLCFI
jgi:hypothetical protein